MAMVLLWRSLVAWGMGKWARGWRGTEPQKAVKRFLAKAIGRNGMPEKITIDKSGANAAAIISYNAEHGTMIHIRTCKYRNNIVGQDHRGNPSDGGLPRRSPYHCWYRVDADDQERADGGS